MGVKLGRGLGRALGSSSSALGDDLTISPSMAAILAATGNVAVYDAGWGYAKDSSDKVSGLASRVGTYTVAQASGVLQPTWGALSPTGKRGMTFASANRLVDPAAVLAQLMDGSQPYSAMWVAKATSIAARRTVWGVGHSVTANEFIADTVNTTGSFFTTRASSGAAANVAGSGTTPGTSIGCMTNTFSGTRYDAWVDGVNVVNGNASLNAKAPTCDTFSIGGMVTGGVWTQPWVGDFFLLVLSTSVWSTSERVALQNAVKIEYGTP